MGKEVTDIELSEEGYNSTTNATNTASTTLTTPTPTTTTTTTATKLSRQQWFDLSCLLFAWACTVCTLTLVVGTTTVVVTSVGGSNDIAPFAVGMFFFGMSIVSLTVTPWLFVRYGRKYGFLIGLVIGLVGTVLGILSIVFQSPLLVIVANLPLGAVTGIGMYLRFASVEVVPASHAANAVTLVLTGGCLAAFIGPEAALATRDSFGDNYTFMGVYMMTGIFQILNGIFVSVVQGYPDRNKNNNKQEQNQTQDEEQPVEQPLDNKNNNNNNNNNQVNEFLESLSFLKTKQFIIPMVVSCLCWAVMAMPMSMVRVAMNDIGYNARQAITVIELHFVGMYAPGFVSGKFIKKYGAIASIWLAIVSFLLGIIIFNVVLSKAASMTTNAYGDDELDVTKSTALSIPWCIGLFLLGAGWNFGFSAATVMVSDVYANNNNTQRQYSKAKVQAANEFLMFLFSGIGIFSSGYIYRAGGGGGGGDNDDTSSKLNGWKTLNYVCLGLVSALLFVMVYCATAGKSVPSSSSTNAALSSQENNKNSSSIVSNDGDDNKEKNNNNK